MLRFWRNPEFVRHVRAELRPPRAVTAALVTLLICGLVGLSCWASERPDPRRFFRAFHLWLVGMQYVVLGVWCAYSCGQAISREREIKTYDFLKTTRLTAGEILVGKVLGTPITAYFIASCALPVSVGAGILGGDSPRVLFWAYTLLLLFALFVSLGSLWISMLAEKSSSGALVFLVLILLGMSWHFVASPFRGFAAISVFPALSSLYGTGLGSGTDSPTLFGQPISYVFCAIVLYVLFGAWFVLMLLRNLKKEREQMRLLSRWQAVGFSAFLNVLFYAFLDPKSVRPRADFGSLRPTDVCTTAVGLNSLILFFVGVTMLTPGEKLKFWSRKLKAGQEHYWSEFGLPWPWLVPAAAIAYGLLVAEAAGLHNVIPVRDWRLGRAAVQFLVFLVFTIRDVSFLQWCILTRLKRPVFKGILYLVLYYSSVGVVAAALGVIKSSSARFAGALTPYYVLAVERIGFRAAPEVFVGLVLQLPLIFLLLFAINARLRGSIAAPVLSPASTN